MQQGSSTSTNLPFKYQDLKVYGSTEWLAGNKKKYRQVFERNDVSYIYAELSFINKHFDGDPWDVNIKLKCTKIDKKKKEICTLEVTRTINKHDHIVHVREGWGHKQKGTFWKKGKYIWEAYIDNEKVASKHFYIEEASRSLDRPSMSPLMITDIQFFEGDYDQNDEDEERVYYTQFYDKETRYVYLEIHIENNASSVDWIAEMFIRFYNSARELKGEVVRLQKIKKDDKTMVITAGWGSNVKGSWRKGNYTIEIIHNDELKASAEFEIGEFYDEGRSLLIYPNGMVKEDQSYSSSAIPFKKTFRELNSLIGLRDVKKQIQDHTQYIKFLKLRHERGIDENKSIALHSIFMGNPGTGKTTVARMLGSIYHHLGLLSKGHIMEVDRVDLIGEFIGQTAPKVKDVLEKARGGVLLIDEAYSLARSKDDSKDFGREVIELLVKEMERPNSDIMIVAAGYPEQMGVFVNSNPGLASRFQYSYEFSDYNVKELIQIMEKMSAEQKVVLSTGAWKTMRSIVQDRYRNRDKTFGNGRLVGQLLEKAKINMGIRLMSDHNVAELSDDQLMQVTLQDVLKINETEKKKLIEVDLNEEELKEALDRLNSLIGLERIKQKINDLVEVIRFKKMNSEGVVGSVSMHTVFVGSPGTGKTTVARIMADIFKALGILERGHIIETDRQGLVAGYVGQTAIKTNKMIMAAEGGVLFIDEAYALNKRGANNDFGDEAVQVLLKQMEDKKGEFAVIVAGYPDKMDGFLKMNPGLKSRFDHILHFEDFNVDQLLEIALSFISERKYRISTDAKSLLLDQLAKEHQSKDERFGNARRVRSYVDEIVKQQNLRLSAEKSGFSSNYSSLIKKVDVAEAIARIDDQYVYARRHVGFS